MINSELRGLPSFQDLSLALHRLLAGKRISVAVAESLTAGLMQDIFARASGSSWYFLGGLTVYSAQQKINLLHVEASLCERYNCVHLQVAEEMARGVSQLFGSTIGVTTTGYAEPNPLWGVKEPMAYYGIYREGEAFIGGRIEATGLDRNGAREYIARYVLNELVEILA